MSNVFSKGVQPKTTSIILEKFIKPCVVRFVRSLEDANYYLLMDQFFDSPHREINLYKALRGFKLPGNHINGNNVMPGINQYKVKRGEKLLVRTDKNDINRVHVQVDPKNNGQVYQLRNFQFQNILPNLELK